MQFKPLQISVLRVIASLGVALFYWSYLIPPIPKEPDLMIFVSILVGVFWCGVVSYAMYLLIRDVDKWLCANTVWVHNLKSEVVHAVTMVLLAICLLLKSLVMWKFVIPLCMKHGSSAGFDLGIGLAIVDVLGSICGFYIVFCSKPKIKKS